MKKKITRISSAIIALLSLIYPSCIPTPIKSYWTEKVDKKLVPIIPHTKSPDKFDKNLRVIELDELGDYWCYEQRQEVYRLLKSKSSNSGKPLVITYVHGWRHNAKENDSDLISFNKLIQTLRSEVIPNTQFTDVVGIYIGWRGAGAYELIPNIPLGIGDRLNSVNVFPTFYTRKAATDRMAGIPLATALWQIKKNTGNGKSIVIGHSFGGRIVERCMSPYILAASGFSGQNFDQKKSRALPADLIFLINPASEELQARELKLALGKGNWGENEAPAMVTISSDNDWPNHGLWPIGEGLALLPNAGYGGRTYEIGRNTQKPEKEYQVGFLLNTVGSDPRLLDYALLGPKSTDKITCPFKDPREAPIVNFRNPGGKNYIWIRQGKDNKVPIRYTLAEPDSVYRDYISKNGYWVIKVPKEVLNGHSGDNQERGIFSDQMIDLFAGIYGMTKPETFSKLKAVPTISADSSKFNKALNESAPVVEEIIKEKEDADKAKEPAPKPPTTPLN